MSKSKFKTIINTLIKGNFFAECSQCGTEFRLKDASLFDQDNFSVKALEMYQEQLEAIKEEKARLKKLKEQGNTRSQVGAKSVNIGFILERIAPVMGSFRFHHNDCRSMFDPIDYVIFEGLSEKGKVNKLFFIDIKTGGARLNNSQKEIKAVIEKKKVHLKKY